MSATTSPSCSSQHVQTASSSTSTTTCIACGVLTEDGERITFALNRATGRFLAEGHHSGARLLFGSEQA